MKTEVAYRDLQSMQCQCGRRKKPGMSVCYRCWQKLPRRVHNALYQTVGYVEAYAEAVAILNPMGSGKR